MSREIAALVRRVNDENGTIRRVRHRIGYAAKYSTHALHTAISHHNQISANFFRGVAVGGVQYGFDAVLLRDE